MKFLNRSVILTPELIEGQSFAASRFKFSYR